MKQRKLNKRKGFTLVELLVVIAILAVLATVSVVGYTSFTKKAKVSNDVSLTTQMNTILQANEVTDGKNATPHEAVEELVAGGLDVTKLTPTANGYNYVWDSTQNRIFLLDEKKNVVSPTNLKASDKAVNLFAFVGKKSELNTLNEYSHYLKDGYDETTITTSTGLDVGNNTEISSVHYTSTVGQEVTIRTNGGTLEVNAGSDTVNHYGVANEVNVIDCAMESYHVYANVIGTITLQKGHIDIEKNGKVANINISSTNQNDFIISNTKGGSVDFVKADNPEIINSTNVNVPASTGVMKSDDKDAVAYSTSKGFMKTWQSVLGEGKTTLLKDLEDQVYFVQVFNGVTATFDLNGHNFKTDESGGSYTCGNMTFMDSSTNQTGLYYCNVDYIRNVQDKTVLKSIGKDAVLTIESGVIEARNASGNFDSNNGQFGLGVQNSGNVVINGGTIKAGWYALAGNGQDANTSSNIIINGGKLISVCDYAIYLPHNGTTIINGGSIDGAAGAIALNRGSLNINGGTLSSAGTGELGNTGAGTDAIGTKSLIVASCSYGDGNIMINGGIFNAATSLPILDIKDNNKATINILSGVYNKNINKWVPAGYECVDNNDGTWTVKKA